MTGDFRTLVKMSLAERHMTQKQLAKRLGCDPSKVSRILNNIGTANYSDIAQIAEELKITITFTRGA